MADVQEVDKLTAEVIRFMLFKAHKQPNVPVKREELTHLITDTYRQRNLPATVISNAQILTNAKPQVGVSLRSYLGPCGESGATNGALVTAIARTVYPSISGYRINRQKRISPVFILQTKLKSIFGLEMVEIQRARQSKVSRGKSASQAPTADVKMYVLKSIVSEELSKEYIETPETASFSGFALVVVGILQLSGDKVPEELLWQQLRRLGIIEHDNNHPVFGNIKQAIDVLVKQRFIQKERISSSDGDTYVMEVAERALDEGFKSKVQAFISSLANGNAAGEAQDR